MHRAMMASNGLRALSRAAQSATRIAPPPILAVSLATPFSTTARTDAAAGDTSRGRHIIRGHAKKNYKKKGRNMANTKKPEPGARKAFRKRIQLSNHNAIAVHGLGTMRADSLADSEMVGKVLCIPEGVVDQLRAIEAFRPTQSWGFFRRPHVLLRTEAIAVGEALKEAQDNKKGLRMVITGDRAAGKSVILLQAMTHAFLNNWVVINIPEAVCLTNATSDYAPIPNTSPLQFSQPSYCVKLLQAIVKANGVVLHTLPCAKDYSGIPYFSHLPAKPTLADLAGGLREVEFAWPTLLALIIELVRVPGRPPLLFTLDGLQHIMKNSAYLDPQSNPVHSHQLAMVRLFTDAMSGAMAFPNGGAVLAAGGGNDYRKIPSMDLVLSQIEAGQAGKEVPQPDPFEKGYDDRVYDVLKDTKILHVGGVSKPEARSLMEYWAKSGLFAHTVNEMTVCEKWTIGGHGILGEMERAALRRVNY